MMESVALESWAGVLNTGLRDESDLELVARTKRGDADAFSVLVRRHERIVYNLSYRYMRDPALAQDMSQESFLKGYRLLKGFRGDCSFSTWMYRVTSSVCLTELNRRKRRDEVELKPYHGGVTDGGEHETLDRAEIIRRCVTRLPERYATIVTLYYLQETPYEEIARALDVPMGTLKTWMFRARKELREIVKQELGDDGLI